MPGNENTFIMDERYPTLKVDGTNYLAIFFIFMMSLFVYLIIAFVAYHTFYGNNARYDTLDILLMLLVPLIFLYMDYYWICGFNTIKVSADGKYLYLKNLIRKWRPSQFLISDIKNVEIKTKIKEFKRGKETRYFLILNFTNGENATIYISSDNQYEVEQYYNNLMELINN